MAKVQLQHWKNGEAFEPKIYEDDLANYEEAEAVLLKSPPGDFQTKLLRMQKEFTEKILSREPDETPAQKAARVEIKLTVAEMRRTFHKLYFRGTDHRDLPLEVAGASLPRSP